MKDKEVGDMATRDARETGTSVGIVYVLTNPAFPKYIKIGKTKAGVDRRLSELYSTGVPLPFECFYAGRVRSGLSEGDVETRLHRAFAPHRVNPRREFFEMEPDCAKAILELLTDDITATVAGKLDSSIDEDEKEVRRPSHSTNEHERERRNGRIIGLHKDGWSQQKIADEVGTSRSTVYYTIHRYRKTESEDPPETLE